MSVALDARFLVAVGRGAQRFTVDVELELQAGVLVLFGPSGAGKSLTLAALAGLRSPERGHIELDGERVFDAASRLDVPARRRRLGFVPQHHSLFPFKDVTGNVAFGLPRALRRGGGPRIAALLDELGIAHLAKARPESLSGGERQRVALARALAVEPRLLLLDEPFASIDEPGRAVLRTLLREVVQRHGLSAAFVTHSAEEAIAVGDRLVRFERGHTVDSGSPAELLGSPSMTLHALPAGRDEDGALLLRDARIEGAPEQVPVRIEYPIK